MSCLKMASVESTSNDDYLVSTNGGGAPEWLKPDILRSFADLELVSTDGVKQYMHAAVLAAISPPLR